MKGIPIGLGLPVHGNFAFATEPTELKVEPSVARELVSRTRGVVYVALFGRVEKFEHQARVSMSAQGTKQIDSRFEDYGTRMKPRLEVKYATVYEDGLLKRPIVELTADGIGTRPGAVSAEARPLPAAAAQEGRRLEGGAIAAPQPSLGRPAGVRVYSTDGLVRIGDHLAITGSYMFSRLAQRAKANPDAMEKRQREYVRSLLMLLAYRQWAAGEPDELTPTKMVMTLSEYLLDPQGKVDLFKGLTDKNLATLIDEQSLRGENPMHNVNWLAGKIDPESENELRQRFDKLYRAYFLDLASRQDLKVASLWSAIVKQYDFEAKQFPLWDNAARSSFVDTDMYVNSRFLSFTFRTAAQPLPTVIAMSTDEARQVAKFAARNTDEGFPQWQAYQVFYATIDQVTLSFAESTPKITVDLVSQDRIAYWDFALTREIARAAPPPSPEVKPPAAPAPQPVVHAPASVVAQPAPPLTVQIPAAPVAVAPPEAVGAPKPKAAEAPQLDVAIASADRPPQPAPAQAVSPPAPVEPTKPTYDIVGLRLGMKLPEATELIGKHMTVKAVLERTPIPSGQIDVFAHARVFVSEGNSEYLVLVTLPDKRGDEILAIGRYVFGGLGAFERGELLAGFREKFQTDPMTSNERFYWGGALQRNRIGSACHVDLGTIGQGNWSDSRGQTPDLRSFSPPGANAAFSGPASMAWIGLNVRDLNQLVQYKDCRPSAAAYIPEVGGRVGEFTIWLTDTRNYINALTGPSLPRPGTTAPRMKL
jgi:hypothetical protein